MTYSEYISKYVFNYTQTPQRKRTDAVNSNRFPKLNPTAHRYCVLLELEAHREAGFSFICVWYVLTHGFVSYLAVEMRPVSI